MTTIQSGLRRSVATLGKPRKATYVVLAIFVLGSLFPFYWSFLVASRDNGMLSQRIPPFVPGGECAGIVRAVGAGVTDFAVGDRVAATMAFGAFAERVTANALGAAKLPDSVPFETGAAVLLAYGTTIHALVDRASLKKGESLLVLGASGGVGSAAIEIGKALGARVIAAARSETGPIVMSSSTRP